MPIDKEALIATEKRDELLRQTAAQGRERAELRKMVWAAAFVAKAARQEMVMRVVMQVFDEASATDLPILQIEEEAL